jgi:rSAM/selenodomain-associated transferase 2
MILTDLKTLKSSIITPVLNEELLITSFLSDLLDIHAGEHIFVDGGSTDRTCQLIRQYPVTLLSSAPGRGSQQNAGAAAATCDTLLFLHCDTRLPENFQHHVQQTLEEPGTVAGAFSLTIDHPRRAYRLIEKAVNLRSRLLSLPYGDQGLFMRKSVFIQAGGFPDQPILEEIPLLRRLRQLGRIGLTPASVTTSARRWQQLGIFRTTLINQMMFVGMLAGISPRRLAKLYFWGTGSG